MPWGTRRSAHCLETILPCCNLSRVYFRKSYHYTSETIRSVWESQACFPNLEALFIPSILLRTGYSDLGKGCQVAEPASCSHSQPFQVLSRTSFFKVPLCYSVLYSEDYLPPILSVKVLKASLHQPILVQILHSTSNRVFPMLAPLFSAGFVLPELLAFSLNKLFLLPPRGFASAFL